MTPRLLSQKPASIARRRRCGRRSSECRASAAVRTLTVLPPLVWPPALRCTVVLLNLTRYLRASSGLASSGEIASAISSARSRPLRLWLPILRLRSAALPVMRCYPDVCGGVGGCLRC
ncbi:hypothetical protein KCP73_21710 [Salmonella enterica subsp. enterica]|nr:hypothetical protein KCP73_21710 [Salmonella enterica subsp. enterica]